MNDVTSDDNKPDRDVMRINQCVNLADSDLALIEAYTCGAVRNDDSVGKSPIGLYLKGASGILLEVEAVGFMPPFRLIRYPQIRYVLSLEDTENLVAQLTELVALVKAGQQAAKEGVNG